MKKRIVSFICVVAVLATMLSVGIINSFADNATVADGEVISIADSFNASDWTSSSGSTWTWNGTDGTLTAPAINNSNDEVLTYKTAYDFSGGFEIAYSSKGNKSKDNYYLGNLYETVKLGNVQVGLTPISDTEPKSLLTANMTTEDGVALFIKVGDNIVAKDFTITKDKNYRSNATKLSHAWKLFYYYTYTDINKFAYTVKYDATAKTVTATLNYDGAQIATTTYTDTANAVDVSNAQFSLITANSANQNPTYANVSVKGIVATSSSADSSASDSSDSDSSVAALDVAVGEVIKVADTFTAADWTTANGKGDATFTFNEADAELKAPDGASGEKYTTLTYKDSFNFTEGFTVKYSALTNKSSDNYTAGNIYSGIKIGNVSFGLVGVSSQSNDLKEVLTANMTTDDGVALAIKVDDVIVATGDFIITKDKNYHSNATKLAHAWKLFYYYTYNNVDKLEFTLVYDATTKTLSGKLIGNTQELGTVTFTDTADTVKVDAAEFALMSHDSYNMDATYANISVSGKTEGNSTSSVAPEKGQAITAVIETELTAADWNGDTECIQSDGTFFIKGNSPKSIFSKIKYDFSEGFEFKSTLTMKNGYTNYYGEYCSVYFGDVDKGLELRVQNVKDQGLYKGYLYFEGKEIATYELVNMPNGEYTITYKDGKVTVALDGVAIGWTLSDKSTSTSVAVDLSDLTNDTVGYRVAGNYHNTDRYWKGFRLAPAGTGSNGGNGSTGDARNVVIPAIILVLSAFVAVFTVTRKKVKS